MKTRNQLCAAIAVALATAVGNTSADEHDENDIEFESDIELGGVVEHGGAGVELDQLVQDRVALRLQFERLHIGGDRLLRVVDLVAIDIADLVV